MNSDHQAREAERLSALLEYDILDTMPEEAFDDLVAIAAQICGTPMALISLVDDRRQWFKARVGLDVSETPREVAFCAHAIDQEDIFVVDDATRDERFANNPLVTGAPDLRFYAGAQLRTSDGYTLGTLCVLDRVPRSLTDAQKDALAALARQAIAQMDLRRQLARQREAEQRHRFILASAVDYAIISMKLDGTVTSWNEGAVQILGWEEHEMCGQPCDEFFTPEDRAANVPEKEMAAALRDGYGRDERWHLRKDGSRFWANGEMMPLTDDSDEAVGYIKILRDRTEEHREHERLQAIEDRFKLALESAGFVGSWDWDVQADRIVADEKFSRFFSVDAREAADGAPLDQFIAGIHPLDRDRVRERIQHCIAVTGDFAEEYRLLNRVGETRWVFARGRCFYDDGEKPTHFPGVVIDITDRKVAELEGADSERRSRQALEAGEMGAWEASPDLKTQSWDARTRELLGHLPDEPIDYETSFLSRVHPDDRNRVDLALRELVAAGDPIDLEYRTVDRNGRVRCVNVRGATTGTEVRRVFGTVRDVTEAKRAEEHRQLLTSELQHRIKNTLSVVQAIVSQSLKTATTPTEARDVIGDRLSVLSRAHDLLTRESWTAAPIGAIVKDAIGFQGARTQRIRVSGPDVRLNARASLALAMALHELATNATKYGALSNEQGHVDLLWSVDTTSDEPRMRLEWREVGGPAVTAPARTGFGSRLMQGLRRDLGGNVETVTNPTDCDGASMPHWRR